MDKLVSDTSIQFAGGFKPPQPKESYWLPKESGAGWQSPPRPSSWPEGLLSQSLRPPTRPPCRIGSTVTRTGAGAIRSTGHITPRSASSATGSAAAWTASRTSCITRTAHNLGGRTFPDLGFNTRVI